MWQHMKKENRHEGLFGVIWTLIIFLVEIVVINVKEWVDTFSRTLHVFVPTPSFTNYSYGLMMGPKFANLSNSPLVISLNFKDFLNNKYLLVLLLTPMTIPSLIHICLLFILFHFSQVCLLPIIECLPSQKEMKHEYILLWPYPPASSLSFFLFYYSMEIRKDQLLSF